MPESEQTLEIQGLTAFYGSARVLDDVTFVIGREPTALIGRNGMGKSTLCMAIMGLIRSVRGSVRFRGRELLGRPPHRVAAAGISYVPQGRRLFPSLSVDEHLRLPARPRRGPWSVDRVYEVFPRLAARSRLSGMKLSGGEQQMLAIGRALVTNPSFLIMDEPSEGLAPIVLEHLVPVIKSLSAEGIGLLVVEQNLGIAAAVADRHLIMVTGRIAAETTGEALLQDPDVQRQYLGVESERSSDGASSSPAS